MGFEEDLAASVRAALAGSGAIREVKMFGGIGFMLNGNMVAGASKRGLLVRVGKDRQKEALERTGTRPMVMRGRAMEGYVYVDPPGLDEKAVKAQIKLAIAYVSTLPPKRAAPNGKKGREALMKETR